MIDYRAKEDFSRKVYFVQDDQIEAASLADVCKQYADTTTTPAGVATRFHVRGNELWTWGVGGNDPALVERFDTNGEASHSLLLSFLYDLENGSDTPSIHNSLAEAEDFLADASDY